MHVDSGSIVGAKFRLERPLSRGGMGAVWLARHVQLGHPVAVKFMDPSYAASPTFRARFEREARTAANLQSPHVVQVQDYGIDGDTPYLVMELLQGEDLSARLQRCGRLALPDVARLLTQAGRGLRRAHDVGLVHRDLKPGNLFLARIEDDEVVKILDFGIAKDTGKRLGGEVTSTGEVMGSPHYMSPEQVRGDKALDHRSDLWSLAVIAFRAATGQLPFPGDVLGSVMAKILVDPIPSPTQVAPDLPPALDGFFARALARDPAQRFQTVRDMVDELSRIAGASPLGSSVSGVMPMPHSPRAPYGSHPLMAAAAATPGAPMPAMQAPISAPTPAAPATPPTTLTSAGTAEVRARGSRPAWGKWAIALGAVVGLGVGITITAMQLLGGAPAEPEAAAPAEAAPAPEAPPFPEQAPTITPAAEAPAPTATASAAAPVATTSTARTAPTGTAPSAKPTASPSKPTGAAPSAKPPKKPDWGL